MALDLTRGDELLAVSRDANRFYPLMRELDRIGRVPDVLASWTYIAANYCSDDPAAGQLTIVATRNELAPHVQAILAEFGVARTASARAAVWAKAAPDDELALSVAMTAAVTVTDRLPRLPGRSIGAVERLCRTFTGKDGAAAMAAARIVVGAATDWTPPVTNGLAHAARGGLTSKTAHCLLILAAAAVDAGVVPPDLAGLADQDPVPDEDPGKRARRLAVRAAVAEATRKGTNAVTAILVDIPRSETAQVLTTWGTVAGCALIRTPLQP